MVDGVDQDRRAETVGERGFILERFLRERRLNTNEDDFSSKTIPLKNLEKQNKIYLEIINLKKNFPNKEILPLDKKIPLNKTDYLVLETQGVDRRVDEFIRQIMREYLPQRVVHPLPNLPVPDLNAKTRFSSATGLYASVIRGVQQRLTIKGEDVVADNNGYADIHFTPEHRSHFDFSRMTDSLTKGIKGVVDLLDAIDQGRFDTASVFVGTTNINMALIAQRLGFVIIDQCRTPDGNINKNLQSFTVVGKLEDIRARVEEFKRAGVVQRLERRSQRLQAKPKLVPVWT